MNKLRQWEVHARLLTSILSFDLMAAGKYIF